MNRNTLIGGLVAVGIILLGVWAYIMAQPSADNTTTTQPPAATDTTTPETQTQSPQPTDTETTPASATITYTDNGFEPATITVKKGATITVTNKSSKDVQFSSADHPTHQKQPELNMETLQPGASGSVVVTQVGTWGYHDHIDASKTGMIVVTE